MKRKKTPTSNLKMMSIVRCLPDGTDADLTRRTQTHRFVTKHACEKHRVRYSISRQHRTSEWQPRGERCPPQSSFIFLY